MILTYSFSLLTLMDLLYFNNYICSYTPITSVALLTLYIVYFYNYSIYSNDNVYYFIIFKDNIDFDNDSYFIFFSYYCY